MALLVLCDPNYRHSAWGETKLSGIMDEAARRRIKPEIFTSIDLAKSAAEKYQGDTSLILLFDSMNYLNMVADAFTHSSIHLILSINYVSIDLPIPYSLVGTDIDDAMRCVIDYLHSHQKFRIAMVGVNPSSGNDCTRIQMLNRYVDESEYSVFYITTDMLACFQEFAKVQHNFDAAICTNDLTAISLTEYLKNNECDVSKLFIISHTDTVLSTLYDNGITSVTTNFYNCGRELVNAHFNRLKYGWKCMRVFLPTELKIRGSTNNLPYIPSKSLPAPKSVGSHQSNDEIKVYTNDVARLERVLMGSDRTRLKIIYCLLLGFSYEKIGEVCFFSIDTAKYHVNKIKQILGVNKKSEAISLMEKYINKDKLLALIK